MILRRVRRNQLLHLLLPKEECSRLLTYAFILPSAPGKYFANQDHFHSVTTGNQVT